MQRSYRKPTVILLTNILVLAAIPSLVMATPSAVHSGVIRDDSVSSTNWSGYAVTGPSGSVTDVIGSWKVPAIQGTCTSTNQYSSHWVGIDGYSSGTVEQIGTDTDCQGGSPAYYAWYEFYPHPSFLVSGMTIRPGDIILAEVRYSGGKYVVIITDENTHQSFTTSAKVKSAKASSAEWISEAPSGGGVLPLANFGTISWGGDYTGLTATNYATIGGVRGTIGSFGASVHQITMATSGGVVKAQPSALTTDGTSFTLTWKSAGP